MANDTPSTPRIVRIFSYMIASLIAVAVVAFVAIIIGTAAGVRDFGEGVWPTVFVLTPIALVGAFILLVAVLVITGINRRRESKDARG